MSKFLTAFVLLLALFQLAAPTTTASAGNAAMATCYGSGCNELSPVTTGCSADGYVVSEAELYDDESNYVGMVYKYWSPTCQAAWTRVESDFRADGVQANVSSSSPSNSYSQSKMNVYTANSPMVYSTAATYVTSCGSIQEGSLLAFACAP